MRENEPMTIEEHCFWLTAALMLLAFAIFITCVHPGIGG
jgi:hypothetical protein